MIEVILGTFNRNIAKYSVLFKYHTSYFYPLPKYNLMHFYNLMIMKQSQCTDIEEKLERSDVIFLRPILKKNYIVKHISVYYHAFVSLLISWLCLFCVVVGGGVIEGLTCYQ